jgi:hypothetical protein
LGKRKLFLEGIVRSIVLEKRKIFPSAFIILNFYKANKKTKLHLIFYENMYMRIYKKKKKKANTINLATTYITFLRSFLFLSNHVS